MEIKSRAELDKLVLKKQAEREESFTKLRQEYVLDSAAHAILGLSDDELISQLQSRKLKAVQVLGAYIAKSLEVTEAINCITEYIPQAKQWAQELDDLPTVKGPFHGLPIAVKDDYDIEGMDTTLGYAKRLYKPMKETCILVKVLQDLGCVPFAKTNVPQSLFAYATDNLIFGKTLNPKDHALSPGGSSGGSGAIVGARGCAFATGSDIGGSLRIPAHFNGVSTLRPTLFRLSGKGVEQCVPKLVGFIGVPGIIAKSGKMLSLVYKELLKDNRQNVLDPRAVPIPWNDELFSATKKLRIGYYTTLPFFPALGDTPKTVLDAKTALESIGHTLLPFQMPNDYAYIQLINTLLNADGGKSFREMFANEPIAASVKTIAGAAFTPEWKRKLAASIISPIFGTSGSSRRGQLLAKSELDARNTEDLWDKIYEKKLITDDVLQKMEDQQLDLLLCPAFPFPAIRVDDAAQLLFAIVYTMIWNLVDFPAGVVPFGKESGESIDAYDDEGDSMLRLAKESAKSSTGMPIGVQFVARPFKEELVLRAMTELEKCAKID